jgi:hypothetical protein
LGEQIYIDVFNREVILDDDVRSNILVKHPEVGEVIGKLSEMLGKPDEIRQSVRDDRVVLYYQLEETVFQGKWTVVVVKQIDRNFISTIYFTDKIKSGEVVWKK